MSSYDAITEKQRVLLRGLPSMSALLERDDVRDWLVAFPRVTVTESLQAAVDATREAILGGNLNGDLDTESIIARAEAELVSRSIPSLRRVINATGIVLHTGLGRAPLCEAAIDAISEAAAGYCNLEYDLEDGGRGRRSDHIRSLLITLTGAESATVVNNNAAATLLILRTFAAEREVIVSRGQLIEIGGSFRLPEIFSAGGAILREVGTTNRTRLADYERAVNERTAMVMRVHPSNYRVVGFSEEVSIAELADLAHRHRLIAVDDLGSGALIDFAALGLHAEPLVRESIASGADLVCFSGDKLVGGPQAGIIAGRKHLVQQIEAHPLMRTYRVDKLTLLALEATLRHYLDTDEAVEHIPTLSMLAADTDRLADQAKKLSEQLKKTLPNESFFICSDSGYAGGGAMPAREIETVVVQWRPEHVTVTAAIEALRHAETPVIARIRDDAICFDLRTIRPLDFDELVAAVCAAAWGDDSEPERDGTPLPIL
jgi:L-seryl-tRNA(Ser) seleniumtransferase